VSEAPRFALDASALLAYLLREPGYQAVHAALLSGAVISAANYGEALSRLADRGSIPKEVDRVLREGGLVGSPLEVAPLLRDDALALAELRALTRSLGLSLGDRACLALGLRLGLPVLTADRAWAGLAVGVDIRVIR
jgi:PIN domain nuclease of toxin-antitoxin system